LIIRASYAAFRALCPCYNSSVKTDRNYGQIHPAKGTPEFIRGNVTPQFSGNFSRIPNELEAIGRRPEPASGHTAC